MKRQIALLVLILALVAVGLFASKATGGGGGCYERVRTLEGTRVDIDGLCFGPTILFADPGGTVTWTNREAEPHNIALVNGLLASRTMRAGGHLSLRFPREGVFPYICQIHMGMTGAVVVGDGFGTKKMPHAPAGIEEVSFSKRPLPAEEAAGEPNEAPVVVEDGDPARRFQPDGGEWFYVFLLVLGASLMLGLIVLGLARKKS